VRNLILAFVRARARVETLSKAGKVET